VQRVVGDVFHHTVNRRKDTTDEDDGMGGMIPLSDASRQTRTVPVATLVLIILNFVMFGLELTGGEAFVKQWSVIPADVAGGHHLITIITAMFMHAGWLHIIGNMIFLWAFGPEIEESMGRLRYLSFYLLCGIAASVAQIAMQPKSNIPNLGASGAIAGVMAAEFFNLLNNVNFTVPGLGSANPNQSAAGNIVGTGNFGKLTSAADPRILQFALKLIF